MNKNTEKLQNGKISTLLIEYSVPAIIGTFAFALYNIVDRIFISRVAGGLAISGVSLTFPLFTILIAFGMLIGVGSGALVSIKLGENKKDEAEKILANAFMLFLILSVSLSSLGLFYLKELLTLFGATEGTYKYASEYVSILLPFVFLKFLSMGMNNLIRAEGSALIAMKTVLIGALLNLILDPILIFKFNMGVKGAAIATAFSSSISALWVFYHFTLSKKSLLKLRLKYFKLDFTLMKPALAIGLSPFTIQFIGSFVGIIANNTLLKYGGDLAIGAMGIIQSIAMFLIMPIIGIAQGAQPIIGFNYGAKNYIRVREAFKLSLFYATGICLIGTLFVTFAPELIIRLFCKNDSQLISIAVNGLRIFMMVIIVIGFQIVGIHYFQSIGKPKISLFLTLSRQVFFLIPLFLILPHFFQLNGIWIAGPISDILSALLTALFIKNELKILNKKYNNQTNLQLKTLTQEI